MFSNELKTFLSNFPIASSCINRISAALITTLFLRNNTETQELERIKAGKFKEVINDLLSNGQMTYKELYEANNYLSIAEKADKYYKEKIEQSAEQNRDFDWLFKFYDCAGKVSDEDTQELWAQILAGEAERPGRFSLKTLMVLSSLSKNEAVMLGKIYEHTMIIGNDLLLPHYDDYLKKDDISPMDILTLNEFGLINFLDNMVFNITLQQGTFTLAKNQELALLIRTNKNFNLTIQQYPFTKVGKELSSLYELEVSNKDIINLGLILRKNNPDLGIYVSKIISDSNDKVSCENIDLLDLEN